MCENSRSGTQTRQFVFTYKPMCRVCGPDLLGYCDSQAACNRAKMTHIGANAMNRRISSAVLVASFFIFSSVLQAQTKPPGRSQKPVANAHKTSQPGVTSQRPAEQPPRELYEIRPGLYVFPAPYSPDYWSPRIRRFDDYRQDRSRFGRRHRPYHPRDRYHRYGRGPRYGDHACGYGYRDGSYRRGLYSAYEQGRYDADHEYLWYIASARAGRLLNQYRELFDEAIIMFRDGQYDWAAIKLLGAAEKNQTSGAARLHAGHALFALGKYEDATGLIARAFELSPGLAHKQYDIRDEYGNKADFERHLNKLQAYVTAHPNNAGSVTLLGYVTFYSEGPGAAYPYLKRAARLDRNSYFIPKLHKLARIASGMEKKPPPPIKAKPLRNTRHQGRQTETKTLQTRA